MPEVTAPVVAAPQAAPQVAPIAPQAFQAPTFDFGGQQITPATPEQANQFKALHRSWQEGQRTITQVSQKVADLEKRIPVTSPPMPAGTPAEVKQRFVESINQFDPTAYDTVEALASAKAQEMADKMYAEHVEPLVLQTRMRDMVGECRNRYPDFGNYKDSISEMINAQPWMLKADGNPFETYYLALKGREAQRSSGAPSFTQAMQDPNAQTALFSDPSFATLVQAYNARLAAQAAGVAGLPPAFVPGSPTVTPPTEIRNARQAGDILRAQYGLPR